jgi:hypothetical protein
MTIARITNKPKLDPGSSKVKPTEPDRSGVLSAIQSVAEIATKIEEAVYTAVESIETARSNSVIAVELAKNTATGVIASERGKAVARIVAEKDDAIRSIQGVKPPLSADSPALQQPRDRGYTVGRLTIEE